MGSTTTEAETESDESDIYEIEVQLRQSALVGVRAESREEAWEAVRGPHSREVSELLTKTDFTGAHYLPEDIIAVNDVDEADIDLTDG